MLGPSDASSFLYDPSDDRRTDPIDNSIDPGFSYPVLGGQQQQQQLLQQLLLGAGPLAGFPTLNLPNLNLPNLNLPSFTMPPLGGGGLPGGQQPGAGGCSGGAECLGAMGSGVGTAEGARGERRGRAGQGTRRRSALHPEATGYCPPATMSPLRAVPPCPSNTRPSRCPRRQLLPLREPRRAHGGCYRPRDTPGVLRVRQPRRRAHPSVTGAALAQPAGCRPHTGSVGHSVGAALRRLAATRNPRCIVD